MTIWKRNKTVPSRQAGAPPVQLRSGTTHPFGMLEGYTPLHCPEFALYRAIREAVPVVDAAVLKLVRLSGGVKAICPDGRAQEELNAFLQTVPTGFHQNGIQFFLDAYLDSLLTCGRAVGELVLSPDGRSVAAVLCGSVEGLEIKESSPLELTLCRREAGGRWRSFRIRTCCSLPPTIPHQKIPTGSRSCIPCPFCPMCC